MLLGEIFNSVGVYGGISLFDRKMDIDHDAEAQMGDPF